MNILFVCHRFPFPPQRGDKIRTFNIVKHLSQNHRVTVASLARSPEEAREGRGIAPHCAQYEMAIVRNPVQVGRMIARLPTATPSSMGYFYSSHLAARIKQLLASTRVDLIVVHCSSVAPYVADVNTIPKILDFGDMDSQKWLDYARYKRFPLSAGYLLEGLKLLRAEQRLARLFDTCTVTTYAEWQTLAGYGTGTDADWFPNGVDAEHFAPRTGPYDRNAICFIGRMDYYPNQECMFDFCRNVLPLVRERVPHARLTIVGANPPGSIRALGQLPGVVVTGSVDDVRSYVHQAAVTVAPLNIARGTQNKILEAMALGVPVVTSPTAAAGVDAKADEHLLVARGHREQANAVVTLLSDPSERERLAHAGRARVLSHHSWQGSMKRFDTIIARCLSSRREAAGGNPRPIPLDSPDLALRPRTAARR